MNVLTPEENVIFPREIAPIKQPMQRRKKQKFQLQEENHAKLKKAAKKRKIEGQSDRNLGNCKCHARRGKFQRWSIVRKKRTRSKNVKREISAIKKESSVRRYIRLQDIFKTKHVHEIPTVFYDGIRYSRIL